MAKTATLQDDFNAGSADLAKWVVTDGEGVMSQTGGQLKTIILANDGSYVYDIYTSVNTYDLTGSYALIEVPRMPNPNAGTEQKFNLELDSNNQIQFIADSSYYTLDLKTGGVSSSTFISPRPATDRWWRIRESGGTIFWDSSRDGNTWVNQKSAAVTFSITALKYVLAVGTWQAVADPGIAIFDNLNFQSTAGEAWLTA